jgi:ribulose-5-phosphate 4-epimerase/fuculose-1-phosphate aldolase
VLDAYGHISVRNPQNPATFFLSRSLAPALVSSREDIEEYYVEDASPVNRDSAKGYAERFIHSELYKAYQDANSVIHSHR